jgi:phosphate transport system substrate-binding protein
MTPEETSVKLHRHGLVAGLVAALALGACSPDGEGAAGGAGPSAATGTAAGIDCAVGSLAAAGSSAQERAYTAWIDAYQSACSDATISYDAPGSGAGRTRFAQGQVPLAGSDSALTEDQQAAADARCAPGEAVDLPTVLTPIALVYTLRGVDRLALTPALIAQILDTRITSWNDPAIAAANPGVTLPNRPITPVHRSSESGTTENLTRFLAAQDQASWPYEPAQAWPARGGLGAVDSAAMVRQIKSTDGAIGYLGHPDAVRGDLTVAAIDTGSGPVELTAATVGKAVSAADLDGDGADLAFDIDYGLTDADAYPAIQATYQITCTRGLPAGPAKLVKSFLAYQVSDAGQRVLGDAGYVPLPAELRSRVRSGIDTIGP